jgi:hypothetical protein
MSKIKLNINGTFLGKPVGGNATKWTIADEAIHRGNNYAQQHAKAHLDAVRYKEATMHAILKNAYQEGFLHGFEHKFDQTNYEEKEDGNALQG